jgi:hypothetical protein
VNYSLLVMEIAGMMKMASGDDFPLRQGAETGLQMSFLWYRGLRWWHRSSRFISEGFSIYRIFHRWNHVKRSYEGAVVPCEHLVRLLVLPRSISGLLVQKESSKSFV